MMILRGIVGSLHRCNLRAATSTLLVVDEFLVLVQEALLEFVVGLRVLSIRLVLGKLSSIVAAAGRVSLRHSLQGLMG